MVILLVICIFITAFFPDFFWFMLLAIAALIIAIGLRIRKNRKQEEDKIERQIIERISKNSQENKPQISTNTGTSKISTTNTKHFQSLKPRENTETQNEERHDANPPTPTHIKCQVSPSQTQIKSNERHNQIESDEKECAIYAKLDLKYLSSYKDITPDPLLTAVRWGTSSCSIYQNCPLVYKYTNISVKNVDRNMLRRMVLAKEYEVTLSITVSGHIDIYRGKCRIGQLNDKTEMCKDWIQKGDPIRCEFVSFNQGEEKVALFFYRDEESKLENHKCNIVRLTNYFSNQKQEVVSFLEKGEKLFIDTDDNDKPYLRNIDHEPIGNLPEKYNRAYEDDLISGIYFDHCEPKDGDLEFYDEDRKEIPFVRIYLSE